MVGATTAPTRGAARLAISVGIRASVSNGPWGPCCSVEPVGTMTLWWSRKKVSTSGLVISPRNTVGGFMAPSTRRASAALLVAGGHQLVPERGGVLVLDVIHHVALTDVDRAELVVEADPGDGLIPRPAPGDGVGDGGLPAHQDRALGLDVVERDDGPVARHHVVHVELPDAL